MRRRVYLAGVVVGILQIPLPIAVADPPLNETYLHIYLKINDAEQLEKQGDYRGALADFKDCYSSLDKIHQEDPNWESALVIKRMEDCKSMIVDLQAKVDSMPPPPPTVPDTVQPGMAPVPSGSSAEADAELNDVASLKARLASVEATLKQTEASLSDSRALVETYKDRLETVNQELQALKNKPSVDDKVGRLLSENKDLADKLTEAQKQLDDYKTNPKSKLALAETQLKNLQDQFDESQAANTSLQQTITTLQQRLDQAQADLVAANQRASTPGPDSAEYATIKRENEVMRAILQREIQEQSRRDEAKRLAQEEFDNLKLKSKVLQEQLDILGSPMTPPTTDEERALIDSLKAPAPDVEAIPSSGNNLTATTTADTNAPPADAGPTAVATSTPPATPPPDAAPTTAPAPDSSTNASPVTIADNNVAPAPPPADSSNSVTNAPTTDPTASNPVTSSGTNPTPPTPDSTQSAAATTNMADNATSPPPDLSPPTTNVAENPAPPAPTPGNSATSSSTQPPTSSDPPTQSVIPAGTTTYTETHISHGNPNSQPPDPTQYSDQPRLPDDERDTAQQAADLFKNARYDDAAEKYQEIIDKYPECLYAWSNLGVVRFQQGKLDEARKALQQAVKLKPNDAFSYSNLGIVYYQLNQYENAIDALNSAKALDPNDAKTRNYLGCACSQKGWQEVAEKEFRKAIELDPDYGDAHFNLAVVYATEKPPLIELARQEYKRALDLGITKDELLEKLLKAQPQQPAQSQQGAQQQAAPPETPPVTQPDTDTGSKP